MLGACLTRRGNSQFVQTYSDGVGRMINPIKEQMEKMKSAIQELKDAGNTSEVGSDRMDN